jgi:hypothetical protein
VTNAHELVTALDELVSRWSSDLDPSASLDHVAVAFGAEVAVGDSHLPTAADKAPSLEQGAVRRRSSDRMKGPH